MVTYFVGKEEVTAYILDFLERLDAVDPFPTIWCPITRSGNVLVKQILDLVKERYPGWVSMVSVVPIGINNDTKKVHFLTQSPEKEINGKSVLLLDTAIHTGSTMRSAAAEVVKMGAIDACSYSLMVKCDSTFIPTMWGFMIDKTDRAFFLLDKIANHRLSARPDRPPPCAHLERLSQSRIDKPVVKCGVDSMDRIIWADRWFAMATNNQRLCCYLLMRRDSILGYLTIHHPEPGCLMIDEVAVDKDHLGQKLGGILLRFADTLARQSDCKVIRLYAIEERIDLYKKFHYRVLSDQPVCIEKERYFPMERALLHGLAESLPPLPQA